MHPKIIRLRDIPDYAGMTIDFFNEEIRPHVRESRIGVQGIAFERVELDAALEEYMRRNERPKEIKEPWGVKEHQESISEMEPGTSTKLSLESAFAKARALATSKKRKSI